MYTAKKQLETFGREQAFLLSKLNFGYELLWLTKDKRIQFMKMYELNSYREEYNND